MGIFKQKKKNKKMMWDKLSIQILEVKQKEGIIMRVDNEVSESN